jgi:uncharacterized protein
VPAVLVDTGPLVALLDRSDPYHHSCQENLSSLDDSLVSVWPVVTEAMYLLRAYWQAQIVSLGIDDIPRMRELMRKYRDLPMDLADAGLVRVDERERLRRIFTLDRRDFQVYRPSRIGRFAIILIPNRY